MFYLAAYALMNIGAFAVVIAPERQGRAVRRHRGLRRAWRREQPLTAAMLTVFLLSLIGVPLTGGFFGKFYIFKAALESHLVWLTVLGLLNSAVAAYYYLRILVMMYMHEPSEAVTGRGAVVARTRSGAGAARPGDAAAGNISDNTPRIRGKIGRAGKVDYFRASSSTLTSIVSVPRRTFTITSSPGFLARKA